VSLCSVITEPSGRSRGYGFVNFSDPEAIVRVLSQDHIIDNRQVQIRPPRDFQLPQHQFPLEPPSSSNALLSTTSPPLSASSSSSSSSHSSLSSIAPPLSFSSPSSSTSSGTLSLSSRASHFDSHPSAPAAAYPAHLSDNPLGDGSRWQPHHQHHQQQHQQQYQQHQNQQQNQHQQQQQQQQQQRGGSMREAEQRRKVFVGILGSPDALSADEMRSYFLKYGPVADLFHPQPSRGFAFVTFQTEDAARSAMQVKEQVIAGVRVHVKPPAPKASAASHTQQYQQNQYQQNQYQQNQYQQNQYQQNQFQQNQYQQNQYQQPLLQRQLSSSSSPYSPSAATAAAAAAAAAMGMPGSYGATMQAAVANVFRASKTRSSRIPLPVLCMRASSIPGPGIPGRGHIFANPLQTKPPLTPLPNPSLSSAPVQAAFLDPASLGVGQQPAVLPGPSLFISNLHYSVTVQDLTEYFMVHGAVLGVDMFRDEKGRSRGKACIHFSNGTEAARAVSPLHPQSPISSFSSPPHLPSSCLA
ncbi:unnamed protein product, partial [Closterium sp. Naga37s-1]